MIFRKYKIVLIGFILFFISIGKVYADGCLGLHGTFTADNWPANAGEATISCPGDNPPGPHHCVGGEVNVAPGEEFNISTCSCIADGTGLGCLKLVSPLPPGCSPFTGGACGVNGQSLIADFHISCQTPPPPAPTCTGECTRSCTKDGQQGTQICTGAADANSCQDTAECPLNCSECIVPQPQPSAPSCGQTCIKPEDCVGARDASGNNCSECLPNGSGQTTCQVPQSPPPACNTPCDRNNTSSCQNAKDAAGNNCDVCRPDASGQDVCQPPLACGESCDINNASSCQGARNAAGQECTCRLDTDNTAKCLPPPPGESPSPQLSPPIGRPNPPNISPPGRNPSPSPNVSPRLSVSPTPVLNAQVKCDNIEPGTILPGQSASVAAFARVTGPDKNKIKVNSLSFFLGTASPSNPNIFTKQMQSGPIAPIVVSNNATEIRYKSTWNFTFPANIDSKSTYRIWATIQSSQQSSVALEVQPVVLTQTESHKGFFSQILDFFKSLFGGKSSSSPVFEQTIIPSPTGIKSIQLRTVQPCKVVATDRCTFVNLRCQNQ